jgi:hypothetical protein
MAATAGLVISLTWTANAVCAQIGSLGSAELFIVPFNDTDPPHLLGLRKSMAKALVKAQAAGYRVVASHGDTDPILKAVDIRGFDICPSRAVINDFFTVSGRNLPDDVVVEFDGPASVVTVTPDFRRPDWILIERLPTSVPAIRNEVRLRSASTGWVSETVPLDVSDGPPEFVRRLYSGAPKNRPYTITFVGNPILRQTSGNLVADPLMSNRSSFHRTVSRSLDIMLLSGEDLLRANGLDRHIQFTCIFDATRSFSDSNALVQEVGDNTVSPRDEKFRSFTDGYDVDSDVTYAVCRSATHTRASAWFTTDNNNGPTVTFTYDGTNRTHGRFASAPGTVAMSTTLNALTPLHEFGHAASDVNNGMVDDLYEDGNRGDLTVNKKFRAKSTDTIPTAFATYNGTSHNSDQNRDGIGYVSTWTSYHCELIDTTRPNLMDSYGSAASEPRRCRLDRLTYRWFTDRLAAKVFR